jgi:hypothetical protein
MFIDENRVLEYSFLTQCPADFFECPGEYFFMKADGLQWFQFQSEYDNRSIIISEANGIPCVHMFTLLKGFDNYIIILLFNHSNCIKRFGGFVTGIHLVPSNTESSTRVCKFLYVPPNIFGT